MSEFQEGTDWFATRLAALQCLSAAWELYSFACQSQESDYDVESAALHLAAIERAYAVLDRAIHTFSPGVVALFGDWHYSSADFDAIARATVGEGARPDFRFGGTCCATAHQSAYVLLRFALMDLESAMDAELDRMGVDDSTLASIDALRALSPEALRDTLIRLEKVAHVRRLFAGQSCDVLRAWIDREWAAVSRAPGGSAEPEAKAIVQISAGVFGVAGYSPRRVTDSEANVLIAFIEAGGPLTKDELVNRSGQDDAVRILKRIQKNYPEFARYIRLPGGKGQGGYWAAVVSEGSG